MRIARRIEEAAGFAPSVVTIGNFDGVHLGHQHLFEEVVRAASEARANPTVLTFDPHPARVVAPDRAPRLLTPIEERCRLMDQYGIAQVLILPFDETLARLSPDDFVREILVRTLGTKIVLVGDNFRFGHKQSGDTHLLAQLGERYGFETRIVSAVRLRNRVVSSSEVRKLVEAGQVSIACRLLKRPYALLGEVVRGHGIGAKQVVPTLNLRVSGEVLPKRGVYITRTRDLDCSRAWRSITNIGYRPTFGGDSELSVETFLLEPLEGLPPGRIRVEFLHRVRDEKKFESPEALKSQVLRDVNRAQSYFRRISA
ncbi:MAG TPA: bifunctional riboflavin kinase/FAD synthetase [Bryobacteraceae bacterium]|jgi:riboflavin kinase/FMN adenylyltransferase|nr:bifunctional riboflavin kinase/FAD synthetase [Bryobacteraceae bacterium]